MLRLSRSLGKWLLAWAMIAFNIAHANGHTVELPPVAAAPYAVGTSTLKLSGTALAAMQAAGREPHQYIAGANLSGTLLYITDLLEGGGSTFTFELAVPSDGGLYGVMAGRTLTYAGVLFYPTAGEFADAPFFDQTLPGMHDGDGAVPFADPSARYPLIVYSHGAGGNPFDTRVAELASHGYAVLSLFHGDDRFATDDAEKLTLRPLAIKAAIDTLQQNSHFKDHLDFERVGGAGFSYGGTTMLTLLGGRVWLPNLASTFNFTPTELATDARLLAIAVDGPYMGSDGYGPITFHQFGSGGTGAQYVTRPVLANVGANDNFTHAQNVFGQLQGTRYLVKYADEGHTLSDQANVDGLNWTLLFLDAFVKQDPQALAALQSAGNFAGNAADTLAIVFDSAAAPGTPAGGEAECTAAFSAESGTLSIPCISVGDGIHAAQLGMDASSPELAFELRSATAAAESVRTSPCLAQYDVATDQVHLPCVDIGGGQTIWAKLALAGSGSLGGMRFRLSSYEGMASGAAAAQTYTLDVSVTANGTSMPTMTLSDVPKPAGQEEFCNDQNLRDQVIQSAVEMGYSGTWSVTSCTFDGASGEIIMDMSIMGMAIPYSATYTYR